MPPVETGISPYTIKPVPPERAIEVVDLWALAYNIAPADPVFGKEEIRARVEEFCQNGMSYIVGAYDGNKLAAVSGIIDFDTHFGARWVKCGGIAGVATYPEYRRQRLVRALLTDCIRKLHKEEVPLSALWPFSYSFYEKLGWAVTDLKYQIEMPLEPLKALKGNSSAYRSAGVDDFAEAADLHERWSNSLNLSLRRSNYRWARLLEDPRTRYKLFVHDEGYMLWNFELSENGGCLEVGEWCYLSDEAFLDGLALIAQMDSQFSRVKLLLPETESVLRLAGLACAPQIKVVPGMMSRVVHREAFLDCLPGKSKEEVDLFDPLGVTAPNRADASLSNGPGGFVQHVTGLWKTPTRGFPGTMHGIIAQNPSYSVERY